MKKVSIYIVIIIAVLAVIIGIAAYASLNPIVNVENLNTNTYLGGQVSLTTSGGGEIASNISTLLMSEIESGNTIVVGNTVLNVTLTTSNDKQICCSYDIVWEWDQTNVTANQYSLTLGATKEFTLSGSYSDYYGNSTADTLGGSNISWFERQLQNYNALARSSSMTRATICNNPIQSSKVRTHSWNLQTNFYNLSLNQDTLKNGVFTGKAKVANVSCTNQKTFADYLASDAPKSGTDAVSNSPWILTSDRAGEWRYAGKNPDNYISFNGELWRIIGVMPNMTYCTGTYGNTNECDTTKTGSLVKIIRNNTVSNSTLSWDYKQTGVGSSTSNWGSNDWSDSQLMLMLNGTNYLKTGYDVNGNKLHQSYTITSNVVAGNGYNYYNATYSYLLDGSVTTVYKPSSATTSSYTATSGILYKKIESTALNQIATVKWDLYGTNRHTTTAEGSPSAFYNKERNINNTGAVYTNASLPENRPVYWYGKVGLMYPSDYGYATNGGSIYNRSTCLEYHMYGWSSGDYKTDCALNSYLVFQNITSTAPGTSGASQWTLSPTSGSAQNVFIVAGYSVVEVNVTNVNSTYWVRPVLYLKADTTFSGGTGTYDNPYRIDSRYYWFAYNTYTYPNNGGTLYTSGSDTDYHVYIGQDTKYHACATISNQEVCLSQPYTQYGLSGHTLNSSFTSAQRLSAKQAIYQAFIDAGINVDIDNDCGMGSNDAGCRVGDRFCGVFTSGFVYCGDDVDYRYCGVESDGHAVCDSIDTL